MRKNYMKAIVNKNNIFRILSDMISESTGTMGYGYSLNEDYIENLFGEKEILKKVISKVEPHNEAEKFILNMYKKGYTLDQIADVAETSVDVVAAIIKKKEPAMA